jgi:DNA-binding IclR family transcriptional regulator
VQKAVPYPIESVDNALRLLLWLRERSRIGVAEAARYLGVAPSTAHRLLAMLRHHGFAVQDGSRAYLPGPVFAHLDLVGRLHRDLPTVAHPHLEALSRSLKETTHLVVLQGTAARFIDGVEASNGLRVGSRAGMSLPAHCTSAGKILLAQLPPAEVAALYPRGLPAGYGPVVTDLATLQRQLAAARRVGYAINREESERGIIGVSVCLRDRDDRVLAAIATAMPTARCPNARIPSVASEMLASAERIRLDLQSA